MWGWSEFIALLVAGAFCISCWTFLEVADEVGENDYQATEENILRAFRDPDDPGKLRGPAWLEEYVRDITALGSAAVLTVFTLLLLIYLLISRRYRHALLVLVAVWGGTVLSSLLKMSYGRERPSVVPHLTNISQASFPSGHAMLSSVVYLTLGALLAQAASRRREHIFFINAALVLALLVGLSRMALGVHYPSDVLAGWSAGTAWALLCWTTAWWLQQRMGPPAPVVADVTPPPQDPPKE